jgi:hypothetical protein
MPSAPTLSFAPKGTTPLDLVNYIKQCSTTDEAILIDVTAHSIPCLYTSRGCKKTFDLPEELEIHVRAAITTDHDHEWCVKCDVGFYNIKEMKRHWVMSPNDVHHHCPVCGYFEVKSDGGMEIHVQRDHGNVRPGQSHMLKCLACEVKVYGAIPMLHHFQVGICKGLSATKEDHNATIEELDTRGGVGEKAWPSLGAPTTSPEKKQTTASTIRVFNPIKKEKKEKLNIHKFTAEERAVMSYASPEVAREAMAQPAGVGWGDGGSAAKPLDVEWVANGDKVDVITPSQPPAKIYSSKRGTRAKSTTPAIALPILPEQRRKNTSQRTVSHPSTPATPAATSSYRDVSTKSHISAPGSRPSGSTQASPAQPYPTISLPTAKPSSSPTFSPSSPTSASPNPHLQDIWDTPIPSFSSSTTPSSSTSSITNVNAMTWSNTTHKLASSPLTNRTRPNKQPRATSSAPQDQWGERDGWVDAVELRNRHLEQTRRNMQSAEQKMEGIGEEKVKALSKMSDWW